MPVGAHAWWTPKRGNTTEEYEDAFWLPETGRSARSFRCAVADGATETSFSGLWARLLVEAYGRGRLGARRWRAGVDVLRCAWRTEVGSKPLPWYAEEKLRQGAFAAFLGLTVSFAPDGPARWSVLAVGDCCLFQVRDERLADCCPITSSDDFNSRPYLIGSVPTSAGTEAMAARSSGLALAGDRLFLMSDAIACWFLRETERGSQPWREIDEATDGFERWIEELRDSGSMRNDDVTLMTVDLPN